MLNIAQTHGAIVYDTAHNWNYWFYDAYAPYAQARTGVMTFDASSSNSVYNRTDSVVQPKALVTNYVIKY